MAVGNLVIAVMGITNHYLMRFRGAPFQISDLKAAKTAGNVFLNYDYMPDLYMLFTVIDLFVWYKLIKQEYPVLLLDMLLINILKPDSFQRTVIWRSCLQMQKEK